MHMIGHQMPLNNFAFFLPCQFPENGTKFPQDLSIQGFLAAFRNKYHMVFAFSVLS